MRAERAIEKTGTAMSATTAGRMPLNIDPTTALSWNWRKNMAMRRMMRKEGRAAPMVVQMAPGSFFSLYPTKTLMFMARAPGQLCVYYKELDILGFDKFWNYAKDDTYPYMWAEANNYFYRGRKVAQTNGGSCYTAP